MKEELLNQMRVGLFAWYPFFDGGRILYIGRADDSIPRYLSEKGYAVDSRVESDEVAEGEYDYIICIETPEKKEAPSEFLQLVARHLSQDGTLLLGMNNRLGLKYFCGDWDKYTNRAFDSIENYCNTDFVKDAAYAGRMYSKAEIEEMIRSAGLKSKFYSVLPNLDYASHIISENALPNEDLASRILPTYHHYPSVFLEEERLYPTLIDNGLFHIMANAYLIECRWDERFSGISYVTLSSERGKERAMATISDGKEVVKKAIFAQGKNGIRELKTNMKRLAERGIRTVPCTWEDDRVTMPYIKRKVTQELLHKKMKEDKEAFFDLFDRLVECVRRSSDVVRTDTSLGDIAEYGYLDMLPLNSFYVDREFVFFDQEFAMPDYPMDAVIARAISTIYAYHEEVNQFVPKQEMYERYRLWEKKEIFDKLEFDFLEEILNWKDLGMYWWRRRRHADTTEKNRIAMDYSADERTHFISGVSSLTKGKNVILFGAGAYARDFLARYQRILNIDYIADNNADKWLEKLMGVPIVSPEIFAKIDPEKYEVIVCMKNYKTVMRQLLEMGVEDYIIYDVSSRKFNYIIGYVAGAFDMFHIGHLNLLRRAKEQCEYLVVGVMSDEKMHDLKGKNPVIPCNERMQVVAGCRYVDEVIELTLDRAGIWDAFEMVHFDCMFSGDDHANDSAWLSERERLRQQGSDIVFVPYTKETSSSEIRHRMDGHIG